EHRRGDRGARVAADEHPGAPEAAGRDAAEHEQHEPAQEPDGPRGLAAAGRQQDRDPDGGEEDAQREREDGEDDAGGEARGRRLHGGSRVLRGGRGRPRGVRPSSGATPGCANETGETRGARIKIAGMRLSTVLVPFALALAACSATPAPATPGAFSGMTNE